jgi:hypothetical protein
MPVLTSTTMTLALAIKTFRARIDAHFTLFSLGAELRELANGIDDAATTFIVAVCEVYAGQSTFIDACRWADEEAAKKQQPRWSQRSVGDRVPDVTLEAAAWLSDHGDAAQFNDWLKAHTASEALAVVQHIRKRRNNRHGTN